MGLSYAHVLGDIFSVSNIVNMWGQILAGYNPNPIPSIEKSYSLIERSANPQPISKEPVSMKRVGPVGDHWVTANNSKMDIYSFHITSAQLRQFQTKISGPNKIDEVGPFECLCAIFWKCIAQIREVPGPNKVTVCRNGDPNPKNINLSNRQIISKVQADFRIKEAGLKELATLLVDQAKSEQNLIEQAVEIDPGTSDFILYGANLTFANWEEATLYGLEFKGVKPVFVNYTIDSIGDDGVVLVLPGPPKDGCDGKDASHGRIVTTILPENELLLLKAEMGKEWSIV